LYWLDYSAGTISGAVIKGAGYEGVIRYTTAPRLMNPKGFNPKHTTKAEYDDHVRAGLKILLVFQGNTTDADSGWNGGVANAKLALEGANYLGYSGPIFFTNDRTTVPNAAAWRGYLDGAASVLGKGRVGAYGFFNAMDLAVGHATYFWQAGRRSDVRGHVDFWQDNNTQVRVGGITCDRNLVLKPMTIEEDDMYTFKDLFYDNPVQEFGNFSQLLANLKDNSKKSAEAAANAQAELVKLSATVAALAAKVDAVSVSGVDVAAVAKAVNDELARRQAD
jgi:hypothetical protein